MIRTVETSECVDSSLDELVSEFDRLNASDGFSSRCIRTKSVKFDDEIGGADIS